MDVINKECQAWLDQIQNMRDRILSNLVMTAQIPAETLKESQRASFVLNRLKEFDHIDSYQDESGNVVGIIKGNTSERKVVISASLDTHFDSSVDHNVSVSINTANGAGVANNSLGTAALISLPEILTQLKIEYDLDIILLATTKSLGKGDLAGMRCFFNSYPFDINQVINLVGTRIGRVDHFSQSTVRGDISCVIKPQGEFIGFNQNNAIIILNEFIESVLRIPLPGRPKTSINFGIIEGGESYSSPCPAASLHFYVRSEEDLQTDRVMEAIKDISMDLGAKTGAEVKVDFFGRQRAAGLRFSHPLVKNAAKIVQSMGYQPKIVPSNSQIVVPMSKGIPSITLGLTTGRESLLGADEYVDVAPIPKGMLQILMLLNNIDKGLCDECT